MASQIKQFGNFCGLLYRKTPGIVWYTILLFNLSSLYLGYDQVMFSALQATPSFLKDFGEVKNDTTLLGAHQSSIMNSVPLVGKFLGCAVAAPINEKFGYKWTVFIGCFCQILGIVLEMATKNWGAFTAGRVLLYMAVGLGENVIPIYQAEVVLPQFRGFFGGVYLLGVAIGSLWASLSVRAISTRTDTKAWLIACCQQFPPGVLLLAGLWWCPPSPRWLMDKGRKEEAIQVLRRVRAKGPDQEEWIELEVSAIEESLEYDKSINTGTWLNLFQGNNLRRTLVCSMLWVGNNWTGNTFISTYATTLYIQLGLRAQAFNYSVIKACITIVMAIIGMLMIDKVGRRPTLIYGCAFQAIFLFIMGGIGVSANPTDSGLRMMVACIMLFKCAVVISLQFLGPVVTAEISSPSTRRKMFAFACCVDVVTAWGVSFSSPYMLSAQYANMGAKVAFIFAGVSTVFVFLCYFFVPELKGRSLEEIDELFAAKLWAWQFSSYKTRGLGRSVVEHYETGKSLDETKVEEIDEKTVQTDVEVAAVHTIGMS
ncbi:general substrate transporter [Naematelia encephala]|uniref:General substrate transporter n=1 Tax=Naematelia encephala TaxID=71784 RepID=A0A1Y2ARH9_9TREE|nr:general substrate transporter [Naematelia encephala]